jgi:hypothetical protein
VSCTQIVIEVLADLLTGPVVLLVASQDSGAAPPAVPGTQFITGVCRNDADCKDGCCGFRTGKCAGPIVAQERDGGCGFGDAQPNANAAIALGFRPPQNQQNNGNANNGNGNNGQAGQNGAAAPNPQNPGAAPPAAPGTQFITGVCRNDADCKDGCCGFRTGKCAGPIIAQERDGGCGFGDAQPNDRAAQALRNGRLGKRGVALWMEATEATVA